MKIKHIILFAFFSICNHIYAQTGSFETVTDGKKTYYNTNNHTTSKLLVENQSSDLNLKLNRNVRINDNSSLEFVKNCISQSMYNSINFKKSIFFIEYVVNQQGNTISSSLINYGDKVSLSNSQIECILNTAMTTTHNITGVPNGVSSFYLIIKRRYKH